MNADVPPYGREARSAQQPVSPYPGSMSRWGPTSMGLDPAIAAGLAYLVGGHFAGIVPIIWLIVEKRNRFIRFHAAQALLLLAAYIAGLLVMGVLFVATMLIALAAGADNVTAGNIGGSFAVVYLVALTVSLLVCQVWGIIAGFRGKFVQFPLVGGLAARLVGGRPVPLY